MLGTNAPKLAPQKQQGGGQESGQKGCRQGHEEKEMLGFHVSSFRLACHTQMGIPPRAA